MLEWQDNPQDPDAVILQPSKIIIDRCLLDDFDERAGKMGFSNSGYGRIYDKVLKRLLYVHQLVWLLWNGELSTRKRVIDHINRNKLDCRIANLRIVARDINNRSRRVGGKSRFPGVWWNKHVKKWQVSIQTDGKKKHVGYFTSELDAARSYRRAYRLLDPISDFECWLELDRPEPLKQTTLNRFQVLSQ
jgi:hypothetical protein